MRCHVLGRVQGVFFRQSTKEEADRLGITGYAFNLPDGSVEVLACGDKTALEQLKRFLSSGPRHARVDTIDCRVVDVEMPARFKTASARMLRAELPVHRNRTL